MAGAARSAPGSGRPGADECFPEVTQAAWREARPYLRRFNSACISDNAVRGSIKPRITADQYFSLQRLTRWALWREEYTVGSCGANFIRRAETDCPPK